MIAEEPQIDRLEGACGDHDLPENVMVCLEFLLNNTQALNLESAKKDSDTNIYACTYIDMFNIGRKRRTPLLPGYLHLVKLLHSKNPWKLKVEVQ